MTLSKSPKEDSMITRLALRALDSRMFYLKSLGGKRSSVCVQLLVQKQSASSEAMIGQLSCVAYHKTTNGKWRLLLIDINGI